MLERLLAAALLSIGACSSPGSGGGGQLAAPDGVTTGADANDSDAATLAGPPDAANDPEAQCAAGGHRCGGPLGNEVWRCNGDGTASALVQTCDAQSVCQNGLCLSPCTRDIKHNTNVGCDYYAVDLQNGDPGNLLPNGGHPSEANFAVIVSNPDPDLSLTVSVLETIDGAVVATDEVAPGGLTTFSLGQRNVVGTTRGILAYYVTGSRPFVAYQFNPLDNTQAVYSNDASLLLPAGGVGREYIAVTGHESGFVTVVGVYGGTEVTITPTWLTASGGGVPELFPGEPFTTTLAAGEVLNINADDPGDLSGTTISATQPVVAFSGSRQSATGGRCCADHLEQQLIPVSSWGTRVVAAKARARGVEPDYWRVVASEDDTVVDFQPAVAQRVTLARGDVFDVRTTESFVISADKPIQVAQILASSYEITYQHGPCANDLDCNANEFCETSQGTCYGECNVASDCADAGFDCIYARAGSTGSACVTPECTTSSQCPTSHACADSGYCEPIGDPALILALTTEQYRSDYVFLVPNAYREDYITISAPLGATVNHNGSPVPAAAWQSLGAFRIARLAVADGVHTVSASAPVGVTVYGFDNDVSYGYPAGTSLSDR